MKSTFVYPAQQSSVSFKLELKWRNQGEKEQIVLE